MDLPRPLERGHFVRRLNRFAATVALGDATVTAHVANSGRLEELLVPDAEAYLHPVDSATRKTTHDLVLVRHQGTLVSLDSRAPAGIAAEALLSTGIPPLPRVEALRREVPLGRHRLDLAAVAEGREWLIEVKGCTLVVDGTALFPDAPTARGREHVEELARRAAKGHRAMVLFVVQRADARRFRPHAEHDPRFAAALQRARNAGVLVIAHACRVTTRRVLLAERLDDADWEL